MIRIDEIRMKQTIEKMSMDIGYKLAVKMDRIIVNGIVYGKSFTEITKELEELRGQEWN